MLVARLQKDRDCMEYEDRCMQEHIIRSRETRGMELAGKNENKNENENEKEGQYKDQQKEKDENKNENENKSSYSILVH